MLNLWRKIGFFIAATGALIYCALEAEGRGDFFIFMSAAGELNNASDIYVTKYLQDYHYYYSVLFAIILRLFYFLPFFWVKFSWLLLNIALFMHLLYLLATCKMVLDMPLKQKRIFLVLVAVVSARFFHENIHTSQITILMLWCSIYGLHQIINNNAIPGSLVLAIGINIKLLPLLILPYLLYRGYFKAFMLTVLFYFGTLVLPSFVIGHNYNLSLLRSWWHLINPGNTQHILDVDERSFHSLTTLLSTLFVENVPDYKALPIKRNIADVSLGTLSAIILFARLILAAFTLYFLKLKPFRKAASAFEQCIEISYILLLTPLIFPHQQHYAFLFIVPAFAVVLYYVILNFNSLKNKTLIITILVLIYLLTNLKLLLGEFNREYEHFKILTYGALLLIPMLAWLSHQYGRSGYTKF